MSKKVIIEMPIEVNIEDVKKVLNDELSREELIKLCKWDGAELIDELVDKGVIDWDGNIIFGDNDAIISDGKTTILKNIKVTDLETIKREALEIKKRMPNIQFLHLPRSHDSNKIEHQHNMFIELYPQEYFKYIGFEPILIRKTLISEVYKKTYNRTSKEKDKIYSIKILLTNGNIEEENYVHNVGFIDDIETYVNKRYEEIKKQLSEV